MKLKPLRLLLFMLAAILAVEFSACPVNMATADGAASGPLMSNPNLNPVPLVDSKYYSILIDKQTEVLTVLRRDASGKYTIIDRQMQCSTGKAEEYTPVGTFNIYGNRYRWRASKTKYHEFMQFACRINGFIMIHSIPYLEKNPTKLDRQAYLELGKPVSAGCIRLVARDAKWIYTNCPNGTAVTVVTRGGPAAVCLTSIPPLPAGSTVDPTDTSIIH
jgi:lipoprotein-anchoring transpeptidase ErfK/SrfK